MAAPLRSTLWLALLVCLLASPWLAAEEVEEVWRSTPPEFCNPLVRLGEFHGWLLLGGGLRQQPGGLSLGDRNRTVAVGQRRVLLSRFCRLLRTGPVKGFASSPPDLLQTGDWSCRAIRAGWAQAARRMREGFGIGVGSRGRGGKASGSRRDGSPRPRCIRGRWPAPGEPGGEKAGSLLAVREGIPSLLVKPSVKLPDALSPGASTHSSHSSFQPRAHTQAAISFWRGSG
jgi:hypothetical protein